MGCRGGAEEAGWGLWGGPGTVNLTRKEEPLGAYTYDEVRGRLREELDKLIAART